MKIDYFYKVLVKNDYDLMDFLNDQGKASLRNSLEN